MMRIFIISLFSFLLFSCQSSLNEKQTISEEQLSYVPEWSKEAVWYQIFVERFRNGDSLNDPTKDDIVGAYPDEIPEHWSTTPWGHDWYKPDAWFDEVESEKFWDRLQLRRYGGDLQGVLDKLDYLHDLGITAIFFNPLNDSPSLHKYDPRHWRHIDRNFGPNPQGDIEIISSEDPVNPQTWKFTSADSLFLKVVKACHDKNIRVILDYSWNHTGMNFWALNDIRAKGDKSEFADWYDVISYDNPETEEDEFKYKGWYGIKYLPEIKKAITGQDSVFPFKGNLYSSAVKQHIFAVAKRWLDPNQDGDLSDGVDGYRLDVAAEIPLGFWPEFRRIVRQINPEAYLVGEIWWQEWPDKLMEPQQFLKGDMFDAIMNYRWFRPARQFFAQAKPALTPSAFVDSLKRISQGIGMHNQQAMMNLTASHDAPRTSTALFNKNLYKYESKPYGNVSYNVNKPDAKNLKIQKMLLVHQFTYIGAPHIWYGDEVGMWGGDDPDCRKPMVWDDLLYEDEKYKPEGVTQESDEVNQNLELKNFIKELIELRKSLKALVYGSVQFILVDDDQNTLAYQRKFENEEILVVFNRSEEDKTIDIPNVNGEYQSLIGKRDVIISAQNSYKINLKGLSASIFKRMK